MYLVPSVSNLNVHMQFYLYLVKHKFCSFSVQNSSTVKKAEVNELKGQSCNKIKWQMLGTKNKFATSGGSSYPMSRYAGSTVEGTKQSW